MYKDAKIGIISGSCGGSAALVACYPFDTVKVRMQSSNHPMKALQCALDIARKEGLMGYYRGMLYPLVSQTMINATVFGVENLVYNNLQREETSINYLNKAVASATAGTVQCLIVCPSELIKIRMQNQGIGERFSDRKFGPWRATITILQNEGLFRGLFKGWWLTLFREVPQYLIYFTTFAAIQQQIARRKKIEAKELGMRDNALAGGFTGVVTWLWYPMDVVKTLYQNEEGTKRYSGMLDCCRKTVKENGYRVLWKGIVPTLVRGFLNGLVTLPVVEYVKNHI